MRFLKENGTIRLMRPKPDKPTFADAEQIAIRVLTFIADDQQHLERFMQLTGWTAQAMAENAGTPAFLGSLLEHILADEPLLLSFTANSGIDPSHVSQARYLLEHGQPTPDRGTSQ